MLFSRFLTLAVLGCALLAGGCDRQSAEQAQPKGDTASGQRAPTSKLDRSQAGRPLPAMTLHDAQGNALDLASLKGKPVLLNLWATWCAPCIAELPTLNEVAHARDGRINVVTVSQDMADPEKVAPFLKDRGLDRLEAWLDPEADLASALGANTLPTTVLFDSKGREVWRYLGDNDWTNKEATALLDAAETNGRSEHG